MSIVTFVARPMETKTKISWTGEAGHPRCFIRSIPYWTSNPGVQLGGDTVEDFDKLMDQAVSLAKEADAVIAVVGLNADWETEGYDRTTLGLPGRTDELISKIAASNKKTIVVTQSVGDLSSSFT